METGASVVRASTITLRTGRKVWLQGLTQRLTYEGLLEGLPVTRTNKAYLDNLVAEQRAKKLSPVYLVTPVETPIDPGPGKTYPFGSPAALPGVTCIGRFRSRSIEENDAACSELTIVWLQNEFAMPIEPSALEEIVRLDWGALASTCDD